MSVDDHGRSAGANLRDAIGSAGVSPPPFGRVTTRARRRREILAGASAVVILVVGGAFVLPRGGTNRRHLLVTGGPTTAPAVRIGPTTTSIIATSTTLPPHRSTPFDGGWQPVPVESGNAQAGDSLPAALTVAAVGKPGIVAFGDVPAGAYSNVVGGWFSSDGARWQRIPNAATIFGINQTTGGGIVKPTAVVPWHNGFVAVGWESVPTPSRNVAAVWSSPDGLHWARETPDAAVFANAAMSSAVVFGDSIIAGGQGGDLNHPRVILWRSTDGKQWQRLAVDPSVFGNGTDVHQLAIGIHGLVAWGDGTGDIASTAVWASHDGNLWQRAATVPVDGNTGTGTLAAFVHLNGTDLVIGNSNAGAPGTLGPPAVWQSTDDLTWSPVNGLGFPAAAASTISALGVADNHVLAAVGDSKTVTLWSSADGRSWDQAAPDPTIFPSTPWGPTILGVLLSTPTGTLLAGGVPIQPGNKPSSRPTAWLWRATAG